MRREEGKDWYLKYNKLKLQISAVCVYVWAEKQRDAPGLSNELSKK